MNRANGRAGFTLPEVTLNLVLVSAAALLAITVLRIAMSGYRDQMTRLQGSSIVDHWIQNLRTDLRKAQRVEVNEGVQINFENGEKRRYLIEDQKLIRSIVRKAENPNEDGRTENWNVPGKVAGIFQIEADGQARLLVCRVELFDAKASGKPYWQRSVVFPIGKAREIAPSVPEGDSASKGSEQ